MDDTYLMGFNPHRKMTRRPSDYLFVVAATAAAIGLVVWVLLG